VTGQDVDALWAEYQSQIAAAIVRTARSPMPTKLMLAGGGVSPLRPRPRAVFRCNEAPLKVLPA
jgi:hypothetical protein